VENLKRINKTSLRNTAYYTWYALLDTRAVEKSEPYSDPDFNKPRLKRWKKYWCSLL